MPQFKKTILPADKYLVTKPDGSRMLKEFSKDYLLKVAGNAKKMIEAGLKIPIPFRHAKEAVPVEEVPETNSYDNAGYWTDVFVEDVDGKPTLCGVADVVGDIDDLESPAGKLMHRVKEVSACIVDAWKDGKDRAWGPSMLHGAAVVNPVVPGQEGFSLLSFPSSESYILSMSGMVQDSVDQGSIAELSKALQESARIYLPPATLPEDLVKVLLVSLKQFSMSREMNDDDAEVIETQSVFMSLPEGKKMPLNKSQAEELVKLGALNPKTNKPFALEDFDIKNEPNDVERYALALTNQLISERKNGLRKRVNDLIATGRATKEYAESRLFPEIDKYELSLGDGAQFVPNNLDLLVESLESLPGTAPGKGAALLSTSVPTGADIHVGPEGEEGEPITKEAAEEMKKSLLSLMV